MNVTTHHRTGLAKTEYYRIVDIIPIKSSRLYQQLARADYILLNSEKKIYEEVSIHYCDEEFTLDAKAMSSMEFAKDLEEIIKE